MYPLTKASENFRKALKIANEITVQKGASYVGSEHFIYAFLCLPECTAYGILASEGVTKNEYEDIFFAKIDKNSKYDGLTRRTQKMYDRAVILSEDTETLAGTAHMLYAILEVPDCFAVKILSRFADIQTLKDKTENALTVLKNKKAFGEMQAESSSLDPLTSEYGGKGEGAKTAESKPQRATTLEKGNAFAKKSAVSEKLSAYGTDMTERARKGKIDPVIGRQKELEKVVQVLARRMKNNPVLIGEPGVGKSAIIEGLSQMIVRGEVPEQLYNKTVFSVDLAGMLAGARYRGDFEERLKDVIGAVMEDGDIVLFIDEIHTLVGAGASSDNGMDAANILKPMLARGDLQVIGATTIEEYRKYMEKDSALERRFTPVLVEEPSEADAIAILKGLRGKYEQHHGIVITDEAIEAAVKLSTRYITDRFLPDKAIDLIDEAAARVRILEDGGAELKALEREEAAFEEERLSRERRGEYALATEAFENKRKTQEKLAALKQAQAPKMLSDGRAAIGREQVAAIVSARMRIPLLKITQEEGEKLMRLEEELHRRIVGQNEAVGAVAKAIRRARAGLKDPSRPIGSFIFVGPTGVGKTDLCKALAEAMFGSEEQMIRLDMSEYMEKQSVSKIIGAPPGYAGYDDLQTGQLTDKVRTNPYSVVLFDEIEKAHPDVMNILLQILDDGRVTDAQGRTVDFCNTVIVMTTNAGSGSGNGVVGFSETAERQSEEKTMRALSDFLRPEFINRVDGVVTFRSLDVEDFGRIAVLMLDETVKALSDHGYKVSYTQAAVEAVAKNSYSAVYGARNMRRYLQTHVEDKIANEIIRRRGEGIAIILIDALSDGSDMQITCN